jgi:hypothetical protein
LLRFVQARDPPSDERQVALPPGFRGVGGGQPGGDVAAGLVLGVEIGWSAD